MATGKCCIRWVQGMKFCERWAEQRIFKKRANWAVANEGSKMRKETSAASKVLRKVSVMSKRVTTASDAKVSGQASDKKRKRTAKT